MVYLRLGEFRKAIYDFKKAIDIDPVNVRYWLNLGHVIQKQEDIENAQKVYLKILEFKPHSPKALWNYGSTLYRQKKYKDALRYFEIAAQERDAPDDVKSNLAEVYLVMGDIIGAAKLVDELPQSGVEVSDLVLKLQESGIGTSGLIDKLLRSGTDTIGIVGEFLQLGVRVRELVAEMSRFGNIEKGLAEDLLKSGLKLSGFVDTLLRVERGNESNGSLHDYLRGRIELEERRYSLAVEYFEQAVYNEPGNAKYLLWQAYAEYLAAEFSFVESSDEYKKNRGERLVSCARILKKAESLIKRQIKEAENAILEGVEPYQENYIKREIEARNSQYGVVSYLQGFIALAEENLPAARRKFMECINKSANNKELRPLLTEIWHYGVKPPLWKKWLASPLDQPWLKLLKYVLFAFFILVVFQVAHKAFTKPSKGEKTLDYTSQNGAGKGLIATLSKWLNKMRIPLPDWHQSVYGIIIIVILVYLIFPGVERVKWLGFEMEKKPSPEIIVQLMPEEFESMASIEKKFPE
jgi:hypothetical protein